MKRSILATLLLLFSATTLAATKTYFSPEDDLEDVVIENIDGASSSIDISIYTFSSAKIKKALLNQMHNGVGVRIIVNKGNKAEVASFMNGLIEEGAQVRYVTKINHHKFMIVDEETLINSSGNFSGSSRSKQYDENVVVCDTCDKHVEAFQTEFDNLFYFSNLVGPGTNDAIKPTAEERKTPINQNVEGIALFTSSNFTPFYSRGRVSARTEGHYEDGTGDVDSVMIEAIDAAKSSLKVATGHLRSKPLYDALLRAYERGIDVQVVLDGQEYISSHKQNKENEKVKKCLKTKNEVECYKKGVHYGRLASLNGLNVLFKYYMYRWHFPYAKQMHHKYMIIDNKVVYSGSYNWSYNAEFATYENVAIFKTKSLVKSFNKNFNDLQNYGGAETGFKKALGKVKTAKSSIATVFDPISMTMEQIDTLKRAAAKKCKRLYQNPVEARSCKF